MSLDDSTTNGNAATTSVAAPKTEEETATDSPPRPRSYCYSRLWMDLTGTCRCTPSFQSIDEIHQSDGSTETRVIDTLSSFSPPMQTANKQIFAFKKAAVVLWKLMVLTMEVVAFWESFVAKPRAFYFGYLTNWALLLSIGYSALSLANTVVPVSAAKRPSVSKDSKGASEADGIPLSARIKMTWAFFTLAAVTQIIVTLLYWIVVHPTGLYADIPLAANAIFHGGFCILVLVDGLVVNRIPIRLRHWFELCLPLFVVYIIWSVIQSPLALDIDNPYMEDRGYDDDKIYPFLDWGSSPLPTLATLLVCVFLVSPTILLVLWALSLLGRLYVVHHHDDDDKYDHDAEDQTSVDDGEDFDIEKAQSAASIASAATTVDQTSVDGGGEDFDIEEAHPALYIYAAPATMANFFPISLIRK